MNSRIAVLCLLLAQIVTGSLANAQGQTSSLRAEAQDSNYTGNNYGLLSLEFPTGIALLYQRRLTENFAAGPFVSYTRWNAGTSTLLRDTTWNIVHYGAEARYAFSSFDTDSFYLAGALQRVSANGQGRGTLLSGGEITLKSNTVSKTGYYGKFGYMWNVSPGIHVDMNASWGTGNELRWTESASGSLVLEDVGASLGLAAGVGVVF